MNDDVIGFSFYQSSLFHAWSQRPRQQEKRLLFLVEMTEESSSRRVYSRQGDPRAEPGGFTARWDESLAGLCDWSGSLNPQRDGNTKKNWLPLYRNMLLVSFRVGHLESDQEVEPQNPALVHLFLSSAVNQDVSSRFKQTVKKLMGKINTSRHMYKNKNRKIYLKSTLCF